jgi:hypothetical protein
MTAKVTDQAKDALEKSEGSLKSQIDKTASKLDKHVGLAGDGITLKDVGGTMAVLPGFAAPVAAANYLMGRGMQPAGSGLMQTGHGMKVSDHGGAVTTTAAPPVSLRGPLRPRNPCWLYAGRL